MLISGEAELCGEKVIAKAEVKEGKVVRIEFSCQDCSSLVEEACKKIEKFLTGKEVKEIMETEEEEMLELAKIKEKNGFTKLPIKAIKRGIESLEGK